MADETYSFSQARARLEEIVSQVRRKDVSLEQSLDLLEEGVRLANQCTELIDHTEWRAAAAEAAQEEPEVAELAEAVDAAEAAETDAADAGTESPADADEAPEDAPEVETEVDEASELDADAEEVDPADEAWASEE